MKVLLIEDERPIREAVAQVLKRSRYQVTTASDGETGLDRALEDNHDLIILDLTLPKLDGLDILKQLREEKITVPIMLLTARDDTDHIVECLDAGADDYLTKPFQMAELLARLRALTRRPEILLPQGVLTCGDLRLDPHTLILSSNHNHHRLTPKEELILELLIKRAGMVVSKDLLIEKAWGFNDNVTNNHLEIHLSNLRKKIRGLNSATKIVTVRGLGYVLKTD